MKALPGSLGAALALWVLAPAAADLRFGADSLPYLARNAAVVVEIGSARSVRATAASQLFEVQPRAVLKGTAVGPLAVVVPVGRDVPAPEMVEGAVLFLRPRRPGAFTDVAPAGRDVFEVVSGGVGVVKPDPQGRRQQSVRDYVAMGSDSASKLAWGRRHLAA